MIALLPPSSSRLLPSRSATRTPICRPTWVEPVNDTSATRRSSTNLPASSVPASMKIWKMAGSEWRSRTRLQMCCTASEHSAVFGEGFHTVALPVMAARNAFQDHTATGKLKAEITPTTPSGCHCSYMRCCDALRMHGQAVQHARLADREIGDVDHFLNLAVALGLDLAVLQGHQAAERILVGAQFLAPSGASPRRASGPAPGASCARGLDRGAKHMLVVLGGGAAHPREALPGRGIDRLDQRTRLLARSSRGCRTRFRG